MSEAQAPCQRRYVSLKFIASTCQILAVLVLIVGGMGAFSLGSYPYRADVGTIILALFGVLIVCLGLSVVGLTVELFLNMAFDQQRQADAMERIANRRRDG